MIDYSSPEPQRQAVEKLERAVALDPGFALAHSALAMSYAWHLPAWYIASPAETHPKAEAAVARALELAPDLPEALRARSLLQVADGRVREGLATLRRIIGLYPADAESYSELSTLLLGMGDVEGALDAARTGAELDPLNEWPAIKVAAVLEDRGDLEEALEVLEVLDSTLGGFLTSRIQAQMGNHVAAAEAMEPLFRMLPEDPDVLVMTGYTRMTRGRPDSARTVTAALMDPDSTAYSPAHAACAAAYLGDVDAAFRWVETAEAEQKQILLLLLRQNYEPCWDNLRPDPRWEALLRKYGFR